MSASVRLFASWLVLFSAFLACGDEPAGPKEKPLDQFTRVNGQWKEIDAQIDDVTNKYRASTDDAERRKLFEQFQMLVGKSNGLIPELRTAALAAYRETPNANADVSKVLVGLVADDVRRDRYESALEIGKLLLEKGCDIAALPGLVGRAYYGVDDFEAAESQLNVAKEKKALDQHGSAFLADVKKARDLWAEEQKAREADAAANLPRVKVTTSKGDIVVELYDNEAPGAVGNFIHLVEKKYYDGLTFHRVLGNFMAQGGCPTGDGTGGPGYKIFCECHKKNHRKHFRGVLSMAHAGRDTGGSQFFLTFLRTPHLDGRHTVFGRVVEGLDVLEKLQRIDPERPGSTKPDTIVSATVLRKGDRNYQPIKVE